MPEMACRICSNGTDVENACTVASSWRGEAPSPWVSGQLVVDLGLYSWCSALPRRVQVAPGSPATAGT